jgi:hypothetical protein
MLYIEIYIACFVTASIISVVYFIFRVNKLLITVNKMLDKYDDVHKKLHDSLVDTPYEEHVIRELMQELSLGEMSDIITISKNHSRHVNSKPKQC